MKRGKKYQDAAKLIDKENKYAIDEAVELVKKTSFVKFDATVEAAFRLNLDPRKAEQNLRGAIVLPHGTGKVSKVVVIAQGEKAKEAEAAGADFVGDADLIQKIAGGWFDFDVMVATPDMMAQLGKLGRILGPRGLMPNPKSGTVTMDVATAVSEVKAGKIEFRVDKTGIVHTTLGKLDFEANQLVDNTKAFVDKIIRMKPASAKGTYVKSLYLTSTMGPGLHISKEEV